jgi:hypothetical protein
MLFQLLWQHRRRVRVAVVVLLQVAAGEADVVVAEEPVVVFNLLLFTIL